MRFLPYHKFTLETETSLSEVIDRLEPHIEAPRRLGWNPSRDRAPYSGTLSASGFQIYRVIHYRNSFLPQIRGRFESLTAQRTAIHITMSLHPFVTAFMLFWGSSWYSISFVFFFSSLLSGDFNVEILLFSGLPLIVLLIFWYAFWAEANRAHQDLTEIILGETLELKPFGKKHSKLFWILAIAIITCGNMLIFGYLIPSAPLVSQPLHLNSCSQETTQSPYCQFSLLYTLDEHPTASAIALNRDRNILVSGGQDKAIKVWNLTTGTLVKTLQSDSGAIASLAISADGKTVVSGSGDRMVRIWDITSDNRPQILKGHSSYTVNSVKISANQEQIISASNDEIKLWNITTGELQKSWPDRQPREIKIGPIILENNSSYIRVLATSPDGMSAFVELGTKLVVWDLETNQQTPLKRKLFQWPNFGRISIDRKTVVTTSYNQPNSYLQIWDAQTGNLKAEALLSSSREYWTDLTLSGDRIISSTEEGLKFFNLQTAKLEATLDRSRKNRLAISADGKYLVGLTGDSSSQTVKIQIFQRP